MSFWRNCEHLMFEYDITQEAFARMIGVAPASVNRWKNGSIPRKQTIDVICDKFGVSYDDLMSEGIGLSSGGDELARIQRAYMAMNDEGRRALVAIAETLLKNFIEKEAK